MSDSTEDQKPQEEGLDKLRTALDSVKQSPLAPAPIVSVEKITDEFEEDFNLVRDSAKDLLSKSKKALDGILAIAEQTDDVKAYEAAAKVLATTGDLATRLMNAHETRQKVSTRGAQLANGAMAGSTTNVYIGTSKELLELLKANRGGKPPLPPAIDAEVVEDKK